MGMDLAPKTQIPRLYNRLLLKATALKGVMGGKGSGAMVAKGLDKVAPGETLPKYCQSNSPYVLGIPS